MHSLKRITFFVKCASSVLLHESRDKGIWVRFWRRWFYPTCYSDGEETHKQSKTCYSISFYNFFFLSLQIYLFLAVLGLHCCAGFLYAEAEATLCSAVGFLWWFLLWRRTGRRHAGFSSCSTGPLELGFSYSVAWDLPHPGPLHWQVDS